MIMWNFKLKEFEGNLVVNWFTGWLKLGKIKEKMHTFEELVEEEMEK